MELRRLLVLAEGQLGDLLLLTPALRALKNGHPRCHLAVLIFQRRLARTSGSDTVLTSAAGHGTSAVLSTHPSVDQVMEVDRSALRSRRGVKRISAERAIARWVREQRFDAVVCTFPEDRFSLLAWYSGARMRIGEKYGGLGALLNVQIERRRGVIGVLDYYCMLAEAAGGRVSTRSTDFVVSAEADREAERQLRDVGIGKSQWVAVHPGASGDYKIWPPVRYAALVEGLRKQNIAAVLLGGDADTEILRAIADHCSAPPVAMHTGNDAAMLAAFLRRSSLCISNDSGPRHLAVAVGTPSLALFRRYHDREWGVYPPSPLCVMLTGESACGACDSGVCSDRIPPGETYGSECLRQVDVARVLEAAVTMFTAASGNTRRTSSGGLDRSGRA